MKDKRLRKSALAFFALLIGAMALCTLAGCSQYMDDDDSRSPRDGRLVIRVTDDHEGDSIVTRVAFAGFRSTFEDGDRIGVYAVSGTTHYADNVCYTYNAALDEWVTTSPLEYNEDLTYYAYFPYIDAPYAMDYSGEATTDAVFAAFIADAGDKFHMADQSTKWAFDASNLMVAKGRNMGDTEVAFAMARQKGLAVFGGGDATDAVFSGTNIPYKNGDMHLYNLKPSVPTTFTDNVSAVPTYTLYADNGKYIYKNITAGYVLRDYLTFVAVEDGAFSFDHAGLSYSLDNGANWTPLAAGAYTPTVTAGNTVMWKNNTDLVPGDMNNTNSMWASTGDDDPFTDPAPDPAPRMNGEWLPARPYEGMTRSADDGRLGIGTFSSTGKFNIEGNVMSLLFGDAADGETDLTGKDCVFFELFADSKVIKAHRLRLPATTLTEYCYTEMFRGCQNLISVPEVLPATTLSRGCYMKMFHNCRVLMTSPVLPATTLSPDCYNGMFNQCASLIDAPALPATDLRVACYKAMFQNCLALKTAPVLPATELAQSCYAYMFFNCRALPEAPALPATTLTVNCYQCMFTDCKKLTAAPFLPALTLVEDCYFNMFRDCDNLAYIKAAFTTVPSERYTEMWTYQVKTSGSYVKNKNAGYTKRGWHGIPHNWTLTTYTP